MRGPAEGEKKPEACGFGFNPPKEEVEETNCLVSGKQLTDESIIGYKIVQCKIIFENIVPEGNILLKHQYYLTPTAPGCRFRLSATIRKIHSF